MIWPAEHMERLRRLWGHGLSAAGIGTILGRSRHAVIGKAHRMGLAPIERQAAARPPARHGGGGQFPWIRKRRASGRLAGDADLADIPLTVIGEPRMVAIGELDASTCRWPIGDPRKPDFGYCGHPTGQGSVYCAGHHAIAWQPADDEEEKPATFAGAAT